MSTQLSISSQVLFGPGTGANRQMLNFSEPSTTTVDQGNTSTAQIADGAANTAINLATLFPSLTNAKVITLKDISATPREVSFSSANTGTKLVLAAGGFLVLRTRGNLPTLYFDNASGGAATIEISAAG